MKHRVTLTKSQAALVHIANDIKQQVTQGASAAFEARVGVVMEEVGAPVGTAVAVNADGTTPGAFVMEWDDGKADDIVLPAMSAP